MPSTDRIDERRSFGPGGLRVLLARQYLTWVRTTISFLAGFALLAIDAVAPSDDVRAGASVALLSGVVAVGLVLVARRVGFGPVVRVSCYVDLAIIALFVTRFDDAHVYGVTFLWAVVVAAAFGTPRDTIAVTIASVVLTTTLPLLVRDHDAVQLLVEGLMLLVVGAMISALGIDEFRAERERARLERQLRDAQRIARLGSFDFDPSTDVARWSEELYRIFAIPDGEALGQGAFLEAVVPEDRDHVARAFAEATATHQDSDFVARIRRRDGDVRDVRVIGTYVQEDEGLRVVGTVQDITEQRRLDAMRDEFVAAASHELRTPTSIVLGFATTLASQWPTLGEEERLRFIGEIEDAAQRLSVLIEDVLQVTQIESGNVRCAADPFDLRAEVEELVRTWPGSLDAEVEGSEAIAVGDVARTRQVLVNLLENAERHAAGATEPVRVRVDRADGVVRVRVIDGGPGIPADAQERIFDRFARFGHSRGGTGLGLYISRRLAQVQGGSLEVSSEPGRGATFTFALPALAGRLEP